MNHTIVDFTQPSLKKLRVEISVSLNKLFLRHTNLLLEKKKKKSWKKIFLIHNLNLSKCFYSL